MKQLSSQFISFNAVVLALLSSQYINFNVSALDLESGFLGNLSVAVTNLPSDGKTVLYRNYSKFSNDNFRKKFSLNLSMENTNRNGLEKFLQLCISTLAQFTNQKINK